MFTGNRNTYTVTQNLNGSWTITGADGTDTLTNVEFGQFNDMTIALGGGVTRSMATVPTISSTAMAATTR